ncbi:GTP pyrophosphokinase [Methanobacterium spitsbergense]|uniref:protein adenylyltransferase n=1 Tax=Methanobacterium spitsbergense TaxID=2874285 RepID=A0A8T5UYJ6_9EURY|nr:hypothetical protein [Methanobacterium spitsbergense]MBZ2164495.1 hypothetical protein [Methanobacterium spitsbergense]
MSGKTFIKEEVLAKYEEVRDKYDRLGILLNHELKTLFEDNEIPVMDIYYRTKDFDSFWKKIERKPYADPFEDIEDLCGIRIICTHKANLDKISKVIRREFDILKYENKLDSLEHDKFDYLSLHFVVSLEDDWLYTPSTRDLRGLKAEIQIRTILMHAWADVSHKISYKREEDVPTHLRRKLNRLIALFEIADDQFDLIVKEIEEYRISLIAEAEKCGRFDVNQELNLDSLQAFMDVYFEGKEESIDRTSKLLEAILEFNKKIGKKIGDEISLKSLVEYYEIDKNYLTPENYDRDDMNEKDKLHNRTQNELTLTILANHKKWMDFRIDNF